MKQFIVLFVVFCTISSVGLPAALRAQDGKILFLNSGTGTGEISRLDNDGIFRTLSTKDTFKTGWTSLVYVFPDRLFFYDKNTGAAGLSTIDGSGNIKTIGEVPAGSFCKNCSHVVFIDDRLVFYEPFSAKQDIVKIGESPIFTLTTLDIGSSPFATVLTAVNDGFVIYYIRPRQPPRFAKAKRSAASISVP